MTHDRDAILQYAEAHSMGESALLAELRRETYLKVLKPNMLSGPLQGSILAMLVRLQKPETILEIGTFTGYATLWMAQVLPPESRIITLDINEELADMVRAYFARSGIQSKIDYRLGNALEMIPDLPNPDMVFIDADKANYQKYYDLVIDRIPSGGLIVADNVLWKGKVTQEQPSKDKRTNIIHEFNQHVHNDNRVENVLLPVRDGLLVVRKL